MSLIEFTDTDVKRGTILEPGWYPVHISEVVERPSKGDGSLFWKMRTVVTSGESKGVPLDFGFSEKAPGFAIPFVKAITRQDVGPGKVDLNSASGKDLEVYVTNGVYENRPTNNVTDYRPSN